MSSHSHFNAETYADRCLVSVIFDGTKMPNNENTKTGPFDIWFESHELLIHALNHQSVTLDSRVQPLTFILRSYKKPSSSPESTDSVLNQLVLLRSLDDFLAKQKIDDRVPAYTFFVTSSGPERPKDFYSKLSESDSANVSSVQSLEPSFVRLLLVKPEVLKTIVISLRVFQTFKDRTVIPIFEGSNGAFFTTGQTHVQRDDLPVRVSLPDIIESRKVYQLTISYNEQGELTAMLAETTEPLAI